MHLGEWIKKSENLKTPESGLKVHVHIYYLTWFGSNKRRVTMEGGGVNSSQNYVPLSPMNTCTDYFVIMKTPFPTKHNSKTWTANIKMTHRDFLG